MKITPAKNSPAFGGTNKLILKGLEKISDHSATFSAATAFLASCTLRPAAINLAPKVDKKNKDYASANSIASGAMKFLITEAVALPVESAVKTIDKNPDKFLKKDTIENFKCGAKSLSASRKYNFAGQLLKLGTNFLSAIPKSCLTIALIPVLMDTIFKEKKKPLIKMEYDPVFNKIRRNKVPFGKKNLLARALGKIYDADIFQKFTSKHLNSDSNVARNLSNATDMLLTGSFAFQIKKSKKIPKENKNPLIFNSLISTGISILGGSAIDSAAKKLTADAVNKFKAKNALDPKLQKYVEGINILRPTLIFAFVYYGLLPYFTTTLAQAADNKLKKT